MGNNVSCTIFGVGSIMINMFDGIVRNLTNVRRVPEIKNILISLGVLDSKCYKFAGHGGALQVFKGSLMVMKATNIGNMYKLEGKIETSEVAVVSKKEITSTCLWHQPLGHINKKGIGL